MTALDSGKPATAALIGDMRLILAWLRGGYSLFARKDRCGLHAWMDTPSPKALDLNPADVARLLGLGLIEEDQSRATETTSTYRLTAAGRGAV